MKRTVLILTLVFASLIAAAPALAGGGFGGDVATAKISGPAVSSTIEIDPTFDSTTKGATGIRLQKGTSASGATFTTPYAASWVMGCDGTHGAAAPTTDPNVNVVTLTQLRFVNVRMRAWVPAGDLPGLFAPLGITIDNFSHIPVITDVDNPVCTAVEDGTRYILSFTATIQFEDLSK